MNTVERTGLVLVTSLFSAALAVVALTGQWQFIPAIAGVAAIVLVCAAEQQRKSRPKTAKAALVAAFLCILLIVGAKILKHMG